MKSTILTISALITLMIGLGACSGISRSDEIDAFCSTFDSRPVNVPNDKVPDAPVTGNGDIGITVAASDSALRFYIGKNDFIRAYPEHVDGAGIALPGGVDISADIIAEGNYHARQLPGSAKVTATFTDAGNVLDVCSWVPATDNKVIIELRAKQRTELTLKLWSPETYGSANDRGNTDGITWVTRSLGDVPTVEFRSDIALAMNSPEGTVILEPGQKKLIAVCIYTSHDTDDWKGKAISEAGGVTTASVKALAREHAQWWSSFWDESDVKLADRELEYWYWSSQYLFACSSREGKCAPGLWGPFITADYTAWAGDYHLNYNYQAPYWACYSSNHLSLAENYDSPLLDFMPAGEKLSRELCGCSGVLYPVGIGPYGSSSVRWPSDPQVMKRRYGYDDPSIEGGFMLWRQKTNAAFSAANMLMRFYSTYDRDYAEKVYPFLKACADFYADYVRERDGRYVIMDDSFWEEAPWADKDGDYNSITALGLARMTFSGASDVSTFLGVDAGLREKWSGIASRLSDYPVGLTPDGRMSLKVRQRVGENGRDEDEPATGLNRVIIHGLVLPSGMVGPLSEPEMNGILLDDIAHWRADEESDWAGTMGNGVETSYPGAVRVGYPAVEVLGHLKERIALSSYPNGWIFQEGGGIETLSAVPMTINEMLLQSYEGVLRIFPNWDRSIDASYRDLRAYGAFLVSASVCAGEIGEVKIVSEKGRECSIENPWPGETVRVMRNGKSEGEFRSDMLEFVTAPGDELVLSLCK